MCSTFSQPGNLFGGLFSSAGSMVVFAVVFSTGGSAGVGGALSVVASLGVIMGVSSGRDIVLHLLPDLYHTPHQKAWFTSSRRISLLHPELKGLGIATVFSCWIFQISQQVKIESCGRRKYFWQRHSSAGGAWLSFFTWHCSLALFRSQKGAHTSHGSFCGCPLQEPWLAPVTSWVFHMPKLSRSSISPTLLLEALGRASSCSPLLNFQLAPGGSR